MCFIWISAKTTIIYLYRRSVSWAVRDERRLFLDFKVMCLAVMLDFLLIWYSLEFIPHSVEQLYRFSTSFFHGCAFVSAGWISNISFIRCLVPKVRTMSKKASYSTEELVLAATWAVSYDSDTAYAARFRKEFKKEPPDQKTITAWKKDLLEKGRPTLQTGVTATQLPHNVSCYRKATLFQKFINIKGPLYPSIRRGLKDLFEYIRARLRWIYLP